MQASREWSPPAGTLGRILEETRRQLPTIDKRLERAGSAGQGAPPGLKSSLRRDSVAIIAEFKRRSPSQGALNEEMDPGRQARLFEEGGASAISVLTEPAFFGGSGADLAAVVAAANLPVLRKDFHISDAQLRLARAEGASAVLLIARALAPEELPSLMRAARGFGLECLVEVRSEGELERALGAGADIVGVNSRDLESLEVDDSVPARLIPMIPDDVIAVWESGVRGAPDVQRAADHGADAVLVGSALSRADDVRGMLGSLTAVARKGRT